MIVFLVFFRTECDNVITANTPVTVLSSPGRPTYVTDADCLNNIVNLSGCISLTFLSMDIEAGTTADMCDKDYLEVKTLNLIKTLKKFSPHVPQDSSCLSLLILILSDLMSKLL